MPLEHVRRVQTLPRINDVTTDTETTPQFSPPRQYESNFAELQRIGRGDLGANAKRIQDFLTKIRTMQ